jgi:arylsulfatase A-like enzyme
MRRFLALLLICPLCPPTLAAEPPGPNIILIYTDDHGYADLGLHGIVKDIRTPHLDALARGGVLASNGYSTAPQCVPSRAGLLTGRFQARFGVESNASPLDGFNRQTTIAARLQKAGYVTAQFGKWHLGPAQDIPRHGFKHVFSQNAQRPFAANITLDARDRPMGDLPPSEYHIDACSRAAAALIERCAARPFFLYIAYRAPHTPLDAPPRYKNRFPGPMPERRRAALAMLSAIDDGVGLLTATLKKHQLTEKTLLFFIGDNGAPLKIHRLDSPLQGDPGGWDGSLNTPLNGEKGMLAEGGIHVPFIIAWPGTLPAGQTFTHPVSALDVAATAATAAHLPVQPGELDGVNLVPHLTGQKTTPPHDFLAWRWIAQSAIREGDWKLLRGGDREYLYDLATDLGEKHNLASAKPDIAARLRSRLTAWTGELDPPGLAVEKMAPTWIQYFDHYLERKTAPAPVKPARAPRRDAATQGWIARNGTASVREGALVLTPDGTSARAFLTQTDLNLPGPVTATLRLRAKQAGQAAFSWRTREQKDFLPASTAAFDHDASTDIQEITTTLPVEGRLIHLRLTPARASGLEIQSLELRGQDGKTRSWHFGEAR